MDPKEGNEKFFYSTMHPKKASTVDEKNYPNIKFYMRRINLIRHKVKEKKR